MDDTPTLVHENRGPRGTPRDFGVVRLHLGEELLGTWKVADEAGLAEAMRQVRLAVGLERERRRLTPAD